MSIPTPWNGQAGGFVPASIGKRIGSIVLGSVIGGAFYLLWMMLEAAAISTGSVSGASWSILVILLWPILELYFLFAKGGTVAQRLLGVQFIEVETGKISGGKLFVKYLLEGAISGITSGIAWVIICIVTFKPPQNQTWFDKTVGLWAIDTKLGRAAITDDTPGQPAPVAAPLPVSAPNSIAPVAIENPYQPQQNPYEMSANPYEAQHNMAAVQAAVPPVVPDHAWGRPGEPSAPIPPPPTPQGAPAYNNSPARSNGPAWPGFEDAGLAAPGAPVNSGVANPYLAPSPSPVSAPGSDEFIASTPFGGSHAPSLPTPAPNLTPRPVIREMRSVEANNSSATIMDPDAFRQPHASAAHLILDGTARFAIDSTAVLGRNPSAPAGLEGSQLISVSDPAMSISKTHFAVGLNDDGSAWVVDLHSTNGTRLVTAADGVTILSPGQRVPLPAGSRVEFGKHKVQVEQ